MSEFDELVGRVAAAMPRFNDFALRGFIKQQFASAPDFVAMVFREGFKYIDAPLELMGYEIVNPVDTVKFELGMDERKVARPKVPLTVSHLRLVRYKIRFGNDFIYKSFYIPYLFEDMLLVKDKRSMIRKVILEKHFSRVSKKDRDGMSASPIRVNMMFNRRRPFPIQSYVTGTRYMHFIVTADIFSDKQAKKIGDSTVVHYMLAKFGFIKTLARFGLTKDQVSFADHVGDDTNVYDYFIAHKVDPKRQEEPKLFLRVHKSLLGEDETLKFVVNLLYVLSSFTMQNMDNVYVEDGWHQHLSIWKIILGMVLQKNNTEARAYNITESHLRSADTFIDPLTRARFAAFGVQIEDTYDLLIYVFVNIDAFMVKTLVQDLYNSRLDVTNGILVRYYAKRIFTSMYGLAKNSNITLDIVKKSFAGLSPMMFKQVSSSRNDEEKDYVAQPTIINDNFLLSGGLNKIRLEGRPEQRLHPSMMVVESIGAFVGKPIGKTGYINPFIPTDDWGGIVHPDYADEALGNMARYIPR